MPAKELDQETRERILCLSSDILRVHYEDDPDLYDASRAVAGQFYNQLLTSSWSTKVYLVQLLLDELGEDLDVAIGDGMLDGIVEEWRNKK